MLNVSLDTLDVHSRQNRLDSLCLRQLVELLIAMHTRELQDERKADLGVFLHDFVNARRLHKLLIKVYRGS